MSGHRELVLKQRKFRDDLLYRVEALRLGISQGTQQHAIENTEHGGVRADGERQSQNCDGRERRVAKELAKGIPKIIHKLRLEAGRRASALKVWRFYRGTTIPT